MTPQIDHLRKMSPVVRVSIHIYGVSKEIDGKTFIFGVNLGMWPLKSIVLEKWPKTCTLNLQLLHNTKKTNKVVWTYEDDWPPKRTSTYKRPFTQEGNYLVVWLQHSYPLFYQFWVPRSAWSWIWFCSCDDKGRVSTCHFLIISYYHDHHTCYLWH